jgi:outer membrane protein assembly factor BamB
MKRKVREVIFSILLIILFLIGCNRKITLDKNVNKNIHLNLSKNQLKFPIIKWKFEVDKIEKDTILSRGTPSNPAGVRNFTIYFSTFDRFDCGIGSYLYAVDINSGKLKWKVKASGNIVGTPFLYGDCIYFGNDQGYKGYYGTDYFIYCVSAETGEVKWKFQFSEGQPVTSSPVVHNNLVYIGCGGPESGSIEVFNAKTGKHVKTIRLSDPPVSLKIKDNFLSFRSSYEGIVDTATLEEIKVFPTKYNDCNYEEENICIRTNVNSIYAIDKNTKKLLWTFVVEGRMRSLIVGNNGLICFSTSFQSKSIIYVISIKNGSLLWKFEYNDSDISTPLIINDNSLYFATEGNRVIRSHEMKDTFILCLNLKVGKLVWKYPTNGWVSGIFIERDTLYYSCYDGYLYALKIYEN